ncbi:pentatricopeptide repeat-containing protein [Canna indica]|uniref:Pentatricopeptide repeat-containing protein n=1 Tax=Canna indica TaxID=4628 RepID=A0AAQ3Q811_9LILI|nr:pentatricopeptide repeat-containing protein [Canna indica]
MMRLLPRVVSLALVMGSCPTARKMLKLIFQLSKLPMLSTIRASAIELFGLRPLFSLAVKKLTRARRPDLIDCVLSPLLSDPKSPKSKGFATHLISLYSSTGMTDHAVVVFDCIPDLEWPCTDKSFYAIILAYFHNRQYDLVVKTFNRAPELGISPGTVSMQER